MKPINKNHALIRLTKQAVKDTLFQFRILTRNLRILPDFLVIGAMRCGTTFLYKHLVKHPAIFSAFRKEIRFFDGFKGTYHQGTSLYRANFPLQLTKSYYSRFLKQPFITGEASPYYIYHPLAPARIVEILPEARLILIIRNPIDRAFSHYNKAIRSGWEPLSFEKAVEILEKVSFSDTSRIAAEGLEMTRDEWLDKKASSCPRDNNAACNAYLAWGFYANYIEHWMKTFPKEQLMIIPSEELYQQTSQTMQAVFNFLNVSEKVPMKYELLYTPQNYAAINPQTRQHLVEYFKPHNQKLYSLLGIDLKWDQ